MARQRGQSHVVILVQELQGRHVSSSDRFHYLLAVLLPALLLTQESAVSRRQLVEGRSRMRSVRQSRRAGYQRWLLLHCRLHWDGAAEQLDLALRHCHHHQPDCTYCLAVNRGKNSSSSNDDDDNSKTKARRVRAAATCPEYISCCLEPMNVVCSSSQ
eukprot:scpid63823/ scgid22156/ 